MEQKDDFPISFTDRLAVTTRHVLIRKNVIVSNIELQQVENFSFWNGSILTWEVVTDDE